VSEKIYEFGELVSLVALYQVEFSEGNSATFFEKNVCGYHPRQILRLTTGGDEPRTVDLVHKETWIRIHNPAVSTAAHQGTAFVMYCSLQAGTDHARFPVKRVLELFCDGHLTVVEPPTF
jgi:hypothetical protein